jgi:hypothetical protein
MALDFDKINKEVANGFIAVQRHPVAPSLLILSKSKAITLAPNSHWKQLLSILARLRDRFAPEAA